MTSTISKIPFLKGQRVKHVKTGNIYTIVRHARCEKSLDWLVVYEGQSGMFGLGTTSKCTMGVSYCLTRRKNNDS